MSSGIFTRALDPRFPTARTVRLELQRSNETRNPTVNAPRLSAIAPFDRLRPTATLILTRSPGTKDVPRRTSDEPGSTRRVARPVAA